MATVLGNVITFFEQVGIYDVVLPFLLTFSITFAILEKTRIFGEEPGQKDQPRKNLNALVAFSIGFLVLASAQLVEAITTISSRMVVLMLLIVGFLMMTGMFFKADADLKEYFKNEKWNFLFVSGMFVAVLMVFLASIKTETGNTWLEWIINYLSKFWTSTAVASILLILGMILVVYYIQKPSTPPPDNTKEKGGTTS